MAAVVGLMLTAPVQAAGINVRRAEAPVRIAAVDAPAATRQAPSDIVVARAVHVTQTSEMTRLVFDLSGSVVPKAFVLADPNRVIIDLPEVNFQIDPATGRPAAAASGSAGRSASKPPKGKAPQSVQKTLTGIILSFRFGRFAAGKSRIVIDLAEPARIIRVESEEGLDGQGARLVLDLARTDAASFALAATDGGKASSQNDERQQARVAPAGDDSRPVVVIDPGHGGVDTGAHGASSTVEKTIVFDFAKSLASRLSAAGRYRVVMTRDEDIFVPLSGRVKIARDAGAALFISIHADTLSDAASVSGATVYTGSDRASDARAALVAEKENMADAAGGLESNEDVSEVSDILFDLTRRETRAYSHVFARTLIGYIKENARLNKNPQRAAGFRVLRAPDVPSVLLELGYLSSEKDLAQLRSPEWRDKAAGSVAKAVDAFFAGRLTSVPLERPVASQEPELSDASVARVIH